MAAAGASDAELLKWSRHTTKEALHRYLYYERVPQAEHQAMQRLATSALMPSAAPPSPEVIFGGGCPDIQHQSGGLLIIQPDGGVSISHERAPKPDHPNSDVFEFPLYVLPEAALPWLHFSVLIASLLLHCR